MTIRPFFRALIPAGILAALVLFVFSTLEYYGPESAVRRFNEGIRNDDKELLRYVIVDPKSPDQAREIQLMEQFVARWLGTNNRFRLKNPVREPGRVTFTVQYSTNNGIPFANAPFVTKRSASGWRVDIHETWAQWNDMARPSPRPSSG